MNGYPSVDYDEDLWVELPPFWGPETWPDHRTWARGIAEMVWLDREVKPIEYEVDNLALGLTMWAEMLGPEASDAAEDPFDGYLYLPHPRAEIVPVRVFTIELEPGDGELADFAGENYPALRPVEIQPIANPALGNGLRSVRHYEGRDGKEEIGIRYVFQVSPSILVMVQTSSTEVPTMLKTLPALDDFARAVSWLEVPAAD